MEQLAQAVVDALLPRIPELVSLVMAAIGIWVGKQQLLKGAAKNAAVAAEVLIGPGHGKRKKQKANQLLSETWHGKMTTQMNMAAVIQEHGMKEVTRRASAPPKPPKT